MNILLIKMINSNLLKINTHGSGDMMLSPFTNVTILFNTLLCRKHGRHGVTHTEIVQSRSSLPCIRSINQWSPLQSSVRISRP